MRVVNESPSARAVNSVSCCAACASPDLVAFEIACALDAGDFKTRVADIRALSSRSLLRSERKPLSLHLTYGPEALHDVEDLVAKESECCSFLNFEVTQDAAGVHLDIIAPVEALPAADELFAHFAPELAREAA